MMKRLVLAVVVSCLFGLGVVLAADSPVGTWKVVDDKSGKVTSQVQLYEQAEKLFGKVTSLTEPTDKDGKAKTCTKCEGADKGKPIVGLVIIQGLSLSGDRYKGGTILDPDDGKVYKAELWVEDGKLKVRGSYGPFHKTQTWLKGN